jgi:hypothetical protein
MVKENKIIKYNLESEVDNMLDQGMSLSEIATMIKQTHTDIVDLQDLSSMSVMRYRNSKDKLNIEETEENGGDYVDTFLKDFRNAMKDLNNKTTDIYNRSITILNRLEKEENSDSILKGIREVANTVEQLRRNWTTLAQYGVRQTSNIYNINLKKEQNTKIMLLEWTKDLCPKCRDKKYKELSKEDIKESSNVVGIVKEESKEIKMEENLDGTN